ncbi:hypothetical protein [Streptomyces sp. AM8-1-1]|uniref:hypothetical protein n=1 Tax=Streptomyces sp. AM8-1-1 TaxID=3075825 RepID=UPI0028C4FCE7|nr:hypothetical protein [Streptomyces sp. AM8-1-1]WNO73893.1 hypothetical protein RPQ07_20700 [Streptomyces sp. AM8-1-1]
MKSIEVIAVIALVVEVGLMGPARFGTERRHWKHHLKRGPKPRTGDDVAHAPAILYGLAAVAVTVAAVAAPLDMSLSTVGTIAMFGVLLPAFAANSVMVLASRGRPEAVTRLQRWAAFAVAVGGGAVSVGLAV